MPPKQRPKYKLDKFILVPLLRELDKKGDVVAEHRANDLTFFNPQQVIEYLQTEWEDKLRQIEATEVTDGG